MATVLSTQVVFTYIVCEGVETLALLYSAPSPAPRTETGTCWVLSASRYVSSSLGSERTVLPGSFQPHGLRRMSPARKTQDGG